MKKHLRKRTGGNPMIASPNGQDHQQGTCRADAASAYEPACQPALRGKAFARPKSGAFQSATAIAQWVFATVRKMDAPSDPAQAVDHGEAFETACMLVASSVLGSDEHEIAKVLAYDPNRVAEWASNLRANGLWLNHGQVLIDHWFDETSGVVGFMLDTLVAQGVVKRSIDPVKGAVYNTVPGRHLLETN
jgi:hypothetical protein